MKEEVDWSKNIQAILAENCIFLKEKWQPRLSLEVMNVSNLPQNF